MTETNKALRIVADYQLMSDSEPRQWMIDTLEHAQRQGLIENFEILGVYPLRYVEDIFFTVDVPIEATGTFNVAMDWDQAKEAATNLLNGPVIPDSDVRVHAVSPLDRLREYALSDCANWESNVQGDCGGRVERVGDTVLCETCRNRA